MSTPVELFMGLPDRCGGVVEPEDRALGYRACKTCFNLLVR